MDTGLPERITDSDVSSVDSESMTLDRVDAFARYLPRVLAPQPSRLMMRIVHSDWSIDLQQPIETASLCLASVLPVITAWAELHDNFGLTQWCVCQRQLDDRRERYAYVRIDINAILASLWSGGSGDLMFLEFHIQETLSSNSRPLGCCTYLDGAQDWWHIQIRFENHNFDLLQDALSASDPVSTILPSITRWIGDHPEFGLGHWELAQMRGGIVDLALPIKDFQLVPRLPAGAYFVLFKVVPIVVASSHAGHRPVAVSQHALPTFQFRGRRG